MYICPICGKEIEAEDRMAKHLTSCWREEHPNHVSKPAPKGENKTERIISNDIMNFFNSFKR